MLVFNCRNLLVLLYRLQHFAHQNVSKYDEICDANFVLYDNILDSAANKRNKAKEEKEESEDKENIEEE